ncbi:MAG: FHA domain-containing protein [Anaerolineales bacterium]|nr:FHA domain-containing protein [Anaerolineales bacterium]
MRRFYLFFLVSVLILSVAPTSAQAQISASVTLYNADVLSFPTISGFVDPIDANGMFASGLKADAVSIVEDGQTLAADSFAELAIPLQLAVAVNQGQALAAQNANGIARFQRVSQVIQQWAQTLSADFPDDVSLISQTGSVISHASPAEFLVSLQSFQPDMRAAVPNLQSLASALDIVAAQTPRVGMKRAVLFITPQMPDPELGAALDPLIQRAVENKIRVFIWYVDSASAFANTSAALFNNLAIQTGGGMFQFSGEERFPDLESYFAPLRRIYQLSYSSQIRSAGEHTLEVQVNLPTAGATRSDATTFNLDVQPPNAFFVSPSLQITRRAPEDDPYNAEILLPETQEIEVIVEFPDGFKRPLTRVTLYADGVAVGENTSEPFTKFVWDLTPYTTSGEHQLSVEAADALGLSKMSVSAPVTITVVKPPSGFKAFLAKHRSSLTFGAILLAGLVLFAILLGGRLRSLSLRAVQERRRAQNDPLTQPLAAIAEPVTVRRKDPKETNPRLKAVKVAAESDAAASLVRLQADGQIAAVPPISLNGAEVIVGKDPVQCGQILDDPSVAPLHARIRATEDGGYLLLDLQPAAGTWINYEALPREGRRLTHGDMVHFGQLKYRFMLRTPPQPRTPKVISVSPEDE